MNIHTRLTDLLVTGGSHVSHAILLDRSRPSKHFWARARIGLWRGVRDRFSTVSTTVHHTLNAVARVKSVIMLHSFYFLRLMGRRSSEEYAAAPGVLTGHSGALRSPADDLMIPGAAGASIPRIGPRPQSLRLSDTLGRVPRDST